MPEVSLGRLFFAAAATAASRTAALSSPARLLTSVWLLGLNNARQAVCAPRGSSRPLPVHAHRVDNPFSQ
jgi:hypothetical protein